MTTTDANFLDSMNFKIRMSSFEIEGYSITPDGYKLTKEIKDSFVREGKSLPTYKFIVSIRFLFPPDLSEFIIHCNVKLHWANEDTGEQSAELASIQTKSTYITAEIPAALMASINNSGQLPSYIPATLATDALTTTRGAFVAKNLGTPVSDAIISSPADQLIQTPFPTLPHNSQEELPLSTEIEKKEGVEVLFDIYEYEDEMLPGMPPVPTYGIETINHKPHTIRVTDHYLEALENGKWRKVDYVIFDDRSERIEYEKGGQGYVKNLRKLPKLLRRNNRFLWRIIGMPVVKEPVSIRGVIIADKKPYYSEPLQYDGSFKSRAMYREK